MDFLSAAVTVLIGSGLIAWRFERWPAVATRIFATGNVVAAIFGLIPVCQVISDPNFSSEFHRIWQVPLGHVACAIDPLTAWFLVPVLVLPALVSIYACDFLLLRPPLGLLGRALFLQSLLTSSMILILVARNGILFLTGWEMAGLATAALTNREQANPEQVGSNRYLAMQKILTRTHLGGACLFGVFVLFAARTNGSLNFADIATLNALPPTLAEVQFLLILTGCGIASGLVSGPKITGAWAASSHPTPIQAILACVLSTLGLYGLMRLASLSGPLPLWGSWVLIPLGLMTSLCGAVQAISQRDLKRLLLDLAMQSRGLLLIGLGLGLPVLNQHVQPAAVAGIASCLVHTWNHALIFGLLFLGTGIVETQTGTTHIDQLGGQRRRLPWTTGAYLLGLVSFCGLPPFNGFISQFLLYWAVCFPENSGDPSTATRDILVLSGLTFLSGLSLITSSRLFYRVFLGPPMSREAAAAAMPVSWRLRFPTLLLGIGCYTTSLLAPQIVSALSGILMSEGWHRFNSTELRSNSEAVVFFNMLSQPIQSLLAIRVTTAVFSLVVILLVVMRWGLLRSRVAQSAQNIVPNSVSSVDAHEMQNLPAIASFQIVSSAVDQPESHRQPLALAGFIENFSLLARDGLNRLPLHFPVLSIGLTLIALVVWHWGWSR